MVAASEEAADGGEAEERFLFEEIHGHMPRPGDVFFAPRAAQNGLVDVEVVGDGVEKGVGLQTPLGPAAQDLSHGLLHEGDSDGAARELCICHHAR